MEKKEFLVILESSDDITAETFKSVLDDSLPMVCSFKIVAVKALELPIGFDYCEKLECIVDERTCWGGTEVCYLQEGCPFSKRSRFPPTGE